MTGTEIDFGDLGLTHAQDTAVREVLVQRENKRRRQCQARMRLAAYCQSERRLLGDGEVKMQVDPYSYHYWGQRLGYQCWQDPEFVEEYLRDNPESRIRSRPDKLTIVAPDRLSISELASHKRFQKTYDLEPNGKEQHGKELDRGSDQTPGSIAPANGSAHGPEDPGEPAAVGSQEGRQDGSSSATGDDLTPDAQVLTA